jgi:Ni/Fe-hydrogenase subunit HybB-like protein
MTHTSYLIPHRFKKRSWAICSALLLLGALGVIAGFASAPHEAWVWLVVCFVIFTGIINAILAWAAIFRVAQASWASSVNRLAHASLAFVPVMAGTLIILLIGVKNYVPWIDHPIPAKAAWLNVPFMVIRDAISLSVFWILAFLFVRWSLAADAQAASGEEVSRKAHYRLNGMATAVVIAFCVSSSIVAYDFIMSLSPEWASTMFAPYYFCANLYAAMAALILLAAALRKPLGVEKRIRSSEFHDMGNLMLAFSLFDMGLFFAQYLTIWYENLPEETPFLILRYDKGAWPWVGWTAFVLAYAVPFIFLQSRRLKENPRWLSPVAVLAILGVCLERYMLVVPSIFPAKLLISPVSILMPLAFLGAFLIAIMLFLMKYSPVSAADAELWKTRGMESTE